MKKSLLRNIILAIFLGFLIVQIIILYTIQDRMYLDTFQSLCTTILKIYSTQLAIPFAALFAMDAVTGDEKVSRFLTILGLAMVVSWNGLLIINVIDFARAKTGDPEQLSQNPSSMALTSTFLIAGTVTYLFNKK